MNEESVLCPMCHHPITEHYAGCMVVAEEHCDGPDDYCQCEEQFNLATKKRLPNRGELIELLERAADTLQEPLAMEIRRKIKGE